mmetsp:Transcript_121150/g.213628  ORF Transcript_121150/g.213628 Transcript_121150/m.213628 type:complete len:82 (-) Transcript_121150:92-337(-)
MRTGWAPELHQAVSVVVEQLAAASTNMTSNGKGPGGLAQQSRPGQRSTAPRAPARPNGDDCPPSPSASGDIDKNTGRFLEI